MPKRREPEEAKRKPIDLSKVMQQHILAAVLRIPGVMPRVRPVLNPDFFEDTAIGDLVARVNAHWDDDKETPSKAALMDAMGEDYRDLIRKVFKEEVPDPEYTVQRIREFANVRAMRLAICRAADAIAAQQRGEPYRDDDGREVDLDPVDLVREAALVGKGDEDIGDDFDETFERGMKQILHPERTERFNTGMGFLDQAGVWLERGELGCVLGASKRGKSHVLANIGMNLAIEGKRVIYYSLEMRADKVLMRLYARLAGKKADIKQDPVGFVARLRERKSKLYDPGKGKFLVKRYPAYGATPDDIRAHLTHLIAGGWKPDVVIIDYGGLLRPKVPLKEKRHELANVFLEMRAIAGEFNVGMWTAAQANRGAVNKEVVTMSDFAECFEIVQHLDIAFSLSVTDAEKADNKGRFYVLASRNDSDGAIVSFKSDFSRSSIETLGVTRTTGEKKAAARPPTGSAAREQAAYDDHKDRRARARPVENEKP